MTVVVALESAGHVHVGTDSFIGSEDERDLSGPKWFELAGGAVLAAYAGDLRAAQVVRNTAKVRAPTARDVADPERFLVSVLMPALRAALDGAGALAKGSSGDAMGAELVLAFAARAWLVQTDFSLIRSTRGYVAAGVGSYAAMGALAALRAAVPGMPAAALLRNALRAAETCHPQVSRPFHVCVR